MERGKGESEEDRKHKVRLDPCTAFLLWNIQSYGGCRSGQLPRIREVQRNTGWLPEKVKHGGEKQLVVYGNAHVARLMER